MKWRFCEDSVGTVMDSDLSMSLYPKLLHILAKWQEANYFLLLA